MTKPYVRPVVTVLGDIRDITRGSFIGDFEDGGFIFTKKVVPDLTFS